MTGNARARHSDIIDPANGLPGIPARTPDSPSLVSSAAGAGISAICRLRDHE